MKIQKSNFPQILPENERNYFSYLEGVISSIDNDSSILIDKSRNSIFFRISPSQPKFSQSLLQEILQFHNLLNIRLNLSKSIRNTSTISFKIEL